MSLNTQEQVNNSEIFTNPINQLLSFENYSSPALPSQTKQCKICLQKAQDNLHLFVSPCQCSGTLKYVHQSCLFNWINHQYTSKSQSEQDNIRSKGLPCQICKSKIFLAFKDEKRCLGLQQIKTKIKNKNCAIFTTFAVHDIIVIQSLFIVNKPFVGEVYLAFLVFSLIFLGLVFVCSLSYMVSHYLISTTRVIQSFRPEKASSIWRRRKSKAIYPTNEEL